MFSVRNDSLTHSLPISLSWEMTRRSALQLVQASKRDNHVCVHLPIGVREGAHARRGNRGRFFYPDAFACFSIVVASLIAFTALCCCYVNLALKLTRVCRQSEA